MGVAADTLMIVMMLVMGGFSMAFLGRSVPAAWRGCIRRAARRPGMPGTASKEGTR